jgi:hypothetical protein
VSTIGAAHRRTCHGINNGRARWQRLVKDVGIRIRLNG